jgi:hypothetical protein
MYLFEADHVVTCPVGRLSMVIVAAVACAASAAHVKIPVIAERLRNMEPPVIDEKWFFPR